MTADIACNTCVRLSITDLGPDATHLGCVAAVKVVNLLCECPLRCVEGVVRQDFGQLMSDVTCKASSQLGLNIETITSSEL